MWIPEAERVNPFFSRGTVVRDTVVLDSTQIQVQGPGIINSGKRNTQLLYMAILTL